MFQDYLVTYIEGLGNQQMTIIRYKPNATWRELQQHFDRTYQYDNLRFYLVGSEIIFKQGE